MSTTKRVRESAQALEDQIRSEISELFLLLKSGKLSPEEVSKIKDHLDEQILALEIQQKKHCCT